MYSSNLLVWFQWVFNDHKLTGQHIQQNCLKPSKISMQCSVCIISRELVVTTSNNSNGGFSCAWVRLWIPYRYANVGMMICGKQPIKILLLCLFSHFGTVIVFGCQVVCQQFLILDIKHLQSNSVMLLLSIDLLGHVPRFYFSIFPIRQLQELRSPGVSHLAVYLRSVSYFHSSGAMVSTLKVLEATLKFIIKIYAEHQVCLLYTSRCV